MLVLVHDQLLHDSEVETARMLDRARYAAKLLLVRTVELLSKLCR